LNKIQIFNINQHDNNNQICDNNLIGGLDTKENKIETNQNQNIFNKKVNNFIFNNKEDNKKKDIQAKIIIKEKEYLSNAHGIIIHLLIL